MSHFDVTLPNYFFIDSLTNRPKQIMLSDIRLCPDYYSQLAAKHGLDSVEENDSSRILPLRATASISKEILTKAGCHEYSVSTAVASKNTATALMENYNSFVSSRKPIDFMRVPVFYDWINSDVPVYTDEIISAFDDAFYTDETAYTTATHTNVLDKTVRDLPGVNNFKFPTERSGFVMKTTRARMNLAPNTKLIFSNPYLMYRFGFTKSQCRMYNKQYIFENETTEWKAIIANNPFCYVDQNKPENAAQDEILNYIQSDIVGDHKVRIEICKNDISSKTAFMEIKNIDWLKKDDVVATALSAALADISGQFNFKLQVVYLDVGKKFKFVFPESQYISNVTIFTGADLATRLKYGPVDYITKDSQIPEDAEDTGLSLEEKARTLVYDAQIVWITLDQTSCNVTLNSNQEVMCMLHPYRDGTMRSSNNDLSHTVKLPNYSLGSDFTRVRFNLWTFDTEGKPTPLKWNTSAIVTGLLRSQ